jgi:hypothetical protein
MGPVRSALSWKTSRKEKADDFKAELKAKPWADQPSDQAIPPQE